jgi:hypothetical protein
MNYQITNDPKQPANPEKIKNPNEHPDPTMPSPGGNEPDKNDPTKVTEPPKTDPSKTDPIPGMPEAIK